MGLKFLDTRPPNDVCGNGSAQLLDMTFCALNEEQVKNNEEQVKNHLWWPSWNVLNEITIVAAWTFRASRDGYSLNAARYTDKLWQFNWTL